MTRTNSEYKARITTMVRRISEPHLLKKIDSFVSLWYAKSVAQPSHSLQEAVHSLTDQVTDQKVLRQVQQLLQNAYNRQ